MGVCAAGPGGEGGLGVELGEPTSVFCVPCHNYCLMDKINNVAADATSARRDFFHELPLLRYEDSGQVEFEADIASH